MTRIIRADAIQFANQLFAGVSEDRLRAVGLDAARDCARIDGRPGTPYLDIWSWLRVVVRELADLPHQAGVPGALTTEDIVHVMTQGPHLNGQRVAASEYALRGFWHWMARAGFAVEIARDHWAITELGVKRIASDDPLRPGSLQRLRGLCDGLPLDDSLDRLDDAQACLEAGLARPTVVLLGLAYEEMISVVLARLTARSVDDLKQGAIVRQVELRKAVEQCKKDGAQEGAVLALNVADTIRRRRNDANHEVGGAWELAEAERLLASGVDAYPKLALYAPAS